MICLATIQLSSRTVKFELRLVIGDFVSVTATLNILDVDAAGSNSIFHKTSPLLALGTGKISVGDNDLRARYGTVMFVG